MRTLNMFTEWQDLLYYDKEIKHVWQELIKNWSDSLIVSTKVFIAAHLLNPTPKVTFFKNWYSM